MGSESCRGTSVVYSKCCLFQTTWLVLLSNQEYGSISLFGKHLCAPDVLPMYSRNGLFFVFPRFIRVGGHAVRPYTPESFDFH